QSINYDNSQLFIKMKEGKATPSSYLIKKVKHLFNDVYLVQTSDAMKLQSELKGHQDVMYTEKNYYAGAKELPKTQVVLDIKNDISLGDSVFNDPDISRVWAFNDASEEGISVNKAYANPLNRTQSDIVVAVVDT